MECTPRVRQGKSRTVFRHKEIDFHTRRFAILDLDLNEGLMNGEAEADETY